MKLKPWMRVGAMCEILGEGSRNVFIIKEIQGNVAWLERILTGSPSGWQNLMIPNTRRCKCRRTSHARSVERKLISLSPETLKAFQNFARFVQ
jgi:hypothetical protein